MPQVELSQLRVRSRLAKYRLSELAVLWPANGLRGYNAESPLVRANGSCSPNQGLSLASQAPAGAPAIPYRAGAAANPPSLRGRCLRAGPSAPRWTDTCLGQAWDNFSRAQPSQSFRQPTTFLTKPTPTLHSQTRPTDLQGPDLFSPCVTKQYPPRPYSGFFSLFFCSRITRSGPPVYKNKAEKNVSPPYRRPGPHDLHPPCHHHPVDCRRPTSGCRSSYLQHLDAPAKRAPGGVFRGVQRQVRHDLCPPRPKGDRKLQKSMSLAQEHSQHGSMRVNWVGQELWHGSMANGDFLDADTRTSSTMCRTSLSSR